MSSLECILKQQTFSANVGTSSVHKFNVLIGRCLQMLSSLIFQVFDPQYVISTFHCKYFVFKRTPKFTSHCVHHTFL